MAAPGLSELITSTLFDQSGEIQDYVLDNIALFKLLKEKKRYKSRSGGYEIRVPFYDRENDTGKWFSGYDTLDITPNRVMSASYAAWKMWSGSISVSKQEELENSGSRTQLFDIIESKMENLKSTAQNAMETGLFSDGSANGGKQLTGLQAAIPLTVNSGTFQGIARSGNTFWQPYQFDLSSNGVTLGAATVKTVSNKARNATVRGNKKTDVILVGDTVFNYFQEAYAGHQIIENKSLAEGGFTSIRHSGMDVIHCGGIGGGMPSGFHMFGLALDDLELVYHKDLNMVPLDPDRYATNQAAMVKHLGFMGNLIFKSQMFHWNVVD